MSARSILLVTTVGVAVIAIVTTFVSSTLGQAMTNKELRQCDDSCSQQCVTTVVDTAHQAAFTNCVNDYQTKTTKASSCTQPALADSDPCKRRAEQHHPNNHQYAFSQQGGSAAGHGLEDKYFNCTRTCKHRCSESCALDTSAPFVADWNTCTSPALKAMLEAFEVFQQCVTSLSG